jgi:hypothetical protein
MKLITVAHMGEAEGLIKNLALERVSQTYFQGSDHALLLTGEGPFEAATRAAATLAQRKFEKVINIGICGSLEATLQLGAIYQVRSIYLVVDGKPQFKSFALGAHGLDLITSFERILNPEKAKLLAGIGSLVDREAWGVAFAAKEASVPLECYKVISDQAGTLEACELVKEKALEFAEIIAQKIAPMESALTLDRDFYFTFTMQKAFENQLRKISLRENLTQGQVMELFDLGALRELSMTPKERAQRLLELMEIKLDPFKGKLNQELKSWKTHWEKQGITLHTDPNWEDPKVRVSFDVKDNSHLVGKLDLLKNLDVNSYHALRSGDLN